MRIWSIIQLKLSLKSSKLILLFIRNDKIHEPCVFPIFENSNSDWWFGTENVCERKFIITEYEKCPLICSIIFHFVFPNRPWARNYHSPKIWFYGFLNQNVELNEPSNQSKDIYLYFSLCLRALYSEVWNINSILAYYRKAEWTS